MMDKGESILSRECYEERENRWATHLEIKAWHPLKMKQFPKVIIFNCIILLVFFENVFMIVFLVLLSIT